MTDLVRREDLLTVSADTTVSDVYKRLAEASGSDFVITEAGQPALFVRGKDAIEKLLIGTNDAKSDSERNRQIMALPVREAIKVLRADAAQTIVALRQLRASPTAGPEPGIYRMPEDEPPQPPDQARVYYTKSEEVTTFYSVSTDVARMATPKIVYRCRNGHINLDPDGGTCYSCPFPVEPEWERPV